MTTRRAACLVTLVLTVGLPTLHAAGGSGLITATDLKQWLSYIASDELEGRDTFTDGLGLAAGYIQAHLQTWGLKPGGDGGTYIQTVRVQGVKVASHSSVTVTVGNETRTFKDGEGVVFSRNAGGKRTLTLDRVEFVGYGLDLPNSGIADIRTRNVEGAAVLFISQNGPKGVDGAGFRRIMQGRARNATDQLKAAAAIGPATAPPPAPATAPAAPGNPATRPASTPDFTTVQRLDSQLPPSITATDAFYEFVLSHAPVPYSELKKKAEAQEPLPTFGLTGVSITFNVDPEYTVVNTRMTQNVVAIVEGTDSQLKSSYVLFGAHYDHVGYAQSELVDGRRPGAPGRVTPGAAEDRIWNGADDDGSGTVALMALARAFQEGPHPKRSLMFVWHAGEERGLLGSRYFADHPSVPLDKIAAQLNIDMIGRNRDDKKSEENSVYLVGSDRISSELHQISRDANKALKPPLTLDYEFNDPADPEQIYYRSDHYSYAAKGIPIVFFTTGLHPDYHANTDEVSKIEFPKMTRIVQLVYETGWRVASLDHAPARDFKGPRAGKGTP